MILHIASLTDWELAKQVGLYRAPSLAKEGFIHCSTTEQIAGVANTLFRGQTGLVVLAIDEARVAAPVVYEDCYQTGQKFPHIYGELPLEAVVQILPFDGEWVVEQ